MQTENRRTCSYAEVQPIFATIRLQNNKKQHKKRLGEARKQVAEGATLKLVKEKSENKGSNRNDLSQKRVLFLFALDRRYHHLLVDVHTATARYNLIEMNPCHNRHY